MMELSIKTPEQDDECANNASWRVKYQEARQAHWDARRRNREQGRRARQLLAAVGEKLQQKEDEVAQVSERVLLTFSSNAMIILSTNFVNSCAPPTRRN